MHALLLALADAAAPSASSWSGPVVIGLVLTALAMLGGLFGFGLTITFRTGRILERIDTHAESVKEMGAKVEEQGKTIGDHETRLQLLEKTDPTERLRVVR
jgi:hypothetical protein